MGRNPTKAACALALPPPAAAPLVLSYCPTPGPPLLQPGR